MTSLLVFLQKFISPIFPETFKTEKAQKRTGYFLTKLLFEGPFGSSAVPLSSFCERGGLTSLTTLPPFPPHHLPDLHTTLHT